MKMNLFFTAELSSIYYNKLKKSCDRNRSGFLAGMGNENPGQILEGLLDHYIKGLHPSIKIIYTGEQEVEKEKPQKELPDNVKAVIESCK